MVFGLIPNFFLLFFFKAMDKRHVFGQNEEKGPDSCPKDSKGETKYYRKKMLSGPMLKSRSRMERLGRKP